MATQLSPAEIAAIAAAAALVPAVASAVYARTQVGAAQKSVAIAADQLASSRGVALGQLLLTIDQLLAQYVDVHARLHPRSPDPRWSLRNPPTAGEQVRIETYMGLFERVRVLIQMEVVPADVARRFYAYRVGNLVNNEWVLEAKLREQSGGWKDFLELCDELDVAVPAKLPTAHRR